MATSFLTRTWSCITRPGYRQPLPSAWAIAVKSSLNGMVKPLSIATFTRKCQLSSPCGQGTFSRRGGRKRGPFIRTRRGYKKNAYVTVLNDTSPDPKSGLVYSLVEDHNGTTGKMQEVRPDFEISPKHCFGDGFYVRRNSFQYMESLSDSAKAKFGQGI